jgi:peptidoglycan lytic transglycosylase D
MEITKFFYFAMLFFSIASARAESPIAGFETLPPQLKVSYTLNSLGSEADDLWTRVRYGFRLEPLQDSRVAAQLKWYASQPEYLNRVFERSRRYLYHIVEMVEQRGMPTEIALLPIVESGFNPRAYSQAKAGGIWQFIPSTGENYGLKANGWYDGRLDILAGTEAALGYLQDLHDKFGDWQLALAAYNCGEGCVAKAISRNRARGKPTDYAHLRLPTETRHYVPKLLALRQIIENPGAYNVVLENIENQPYFVPVSLTHPMDMQLAARLADVGMDEMKSLNPAYKRPVIHSNTPLTLLLPADKAERFAANLERYEPSVIAVETYDASKDERLDDIASQFSTTVDWLKERNPIKIRSGRLLRDQVLIVPAKPEADIDNKPLNLTQTLQFGTEFAEYVVQQGETLQSIASRHHVSLDSILAWNPKSRNGLKSGQIIKILPEQDLATLEPSSDNVTNDKTVVTLADTAPKLQ